jgi:hypothetical protein
MLFKNFFSGYDSTNAIEQIPLCDVFTPRIFDALQFTKNNTIKILTLGEKEVWNKSRDFLTKSVLIDTLWLQRTPKVIFAHDFLCLIQLYWFLDYKREWIAEQISKLFIANPVLVIRSSGLWDWKWVWVYDSVFILNKPEHIMDAVQKVSESTMTESAKQFRKKLWILDDHHGIIIEPCVWKEQIPWFFWPLLSGYWTSQNKQWVFEMNVAVWLWWWVNDISVLNIQQHHIDTLRKTTLWTVIKKHFSEDDTNALISWYYKKTDFLLEGIDLTDWKLAQYQLQKNNEIYEFDIKKYANKMRKIQSMTHTPHYFEFATTCPNDATQTYVTQLSEDVLERKSVEWWDFGIAINKMNNVLNTGKVTVDKIIVLNVFDRAISCEKLLWEYNRNNKDYIILTTSDTSEFKKKWDFESFSNALWIIEYNKRMDSNKNINYIAWHYWWLLDVTNILFWVWDSEDLPNKKIENFWVLKKYPIAWSQLVVEYSGAQFTFIQDAEKQRWALYISDLS